MPRPEKMVVRPRLRFAIMISSKRTILGSFDFGLIRSRSLMNSLNPNHSLATMRLINLETDMLLSQFLPWLCCKALMYAACS